MALQVRFAMIDKTGGAIGEKATFFFGEQGKIGLPHSCVTAAWVGLAMAWPDAQPARELQMTAAAT